MKLHIFGSNSSGNGYALEGKKETLLIECGVSLSKVKKQLDFDLSKVSGCIISHEHGDHFKFHSEFSKAGIDLYGTHGTFFKIQRNHRHITIVEGVDFNIGSFKIKPFKITHDAIEPVGFLIHHHECGLVLFLTDTKYCSYEFPKLNNIIVEANYSESILMDKTWNQTINPYLTSRIIESHMSIETCKELLKANDLSEVNNIVLIHLSNGNSDAKNFQKEVKELTNKTVHVADSGMIIEFNKTPF
jgi:phosphoribosyl 1,2-cyclic phosphodiesterase